MSSQPSPNPSARQAWGEPEKRAWLEQTSVQRSYREEVLEKFALVSDAFVCDQYGALDFDPERYPLFAFRNRLVDQNKPWALITGGVHGYETSGVQGALQFLIEHAPSYLDRFNIVVVPCVSPWGYETINRWNPYTVDPNRSFTDSSPAQEAKQLMAYVQQFEVEFLMHIDLHETTDTDASVFRPALAARDGIAESETHIPDGFYLVADEPNPELAFQAAIIERVATVTHIAPANEQGQLIGSDEVAPGVILYAGRSMGLCGGFAGSKYTTTTEVYPDSAKVSSRDCILAQVAAVQAGLDFVAKEI